MYHAYLQQEITWGLAGHFDPDSGTYCDCTNGSATSDRYHSASHRYFTASDWHHPAPEGHYCATHRYNPTAYGHATTANRDDTTANRYTIASDRHDTTAYGHAIASDRWYESANRQHRAKALLYPRTRSVESTRC